MKFLFTLFFSFIFTIPFLANSAEINTDDRDVEDGNLISEPLLADYVQAERSPGILVEPYDIQEIDGSN